MSDFRFDPPKPDDGVGCIGLIFLFLFVFSAIVFGMWLEAKVWFLVWGQPS